MIRDQGVLGMPIKPEIEFAPLELGNLGDALVSVIFPTRRDDCDHDDDQDQKSDCSKPGEEIFLSTATHEEVLPHLSLEENDLQRFDGQTYTLTGPETTTGPKLVEELNRVLSYDSESEENEGESGSQVRTSFGVEKKKKTASTLGVEPLKVPFLLTLCHLFLTASLSTTCIAHR